MELEQLRLARSSQGLRGAGVTLGASQTTAERCWIEWEERTCGQGSSRMTGLGLRCLFSSVSPDKWNSFIFKNSLILACFLLC